MDYAVNIICVLNHKNKSTTFISRYGLAFLPILKGMMREALVIKILITGGAGFIGSHLAERFLSEGHEVVCLDNFDPYYDPGIKRMNIAPLIGRDNFSLVEGDLLDQDLLIRNLIGVDCIFHHAAQPGVRTSVDDPIKPHRVNATGTLCLLKAALDSDVKKVIYASSSSVYGHVRYLPFDEAHPTKPVSPYGVSKLMAEHYCRIFHEIYGLQTVSLRYFTVYGPRMRPDLAIGIFMGRALSGEEIEIFGRGDKTRDFTYIDDVVEANVLAMRIKTGSSEYNIGGGRRISIRELAENIIEITGSPSKLRYGKNILGDADHTWADTAKAKKELGWLPKTGIKEGLRKYAEWYCNHHQPVKMRRSGIFK